MGTGYYKHGRVVRSVNVCCHISIAMEAENCNRLTGMTEMMIDQVDKGGRFGTTAYFCNDCLKIFGLSPNSPISFLSMINEDNPAHFAALSTLEKVCKSCFETFVGL